MNKLKKIIPMFIIAAIMLGNINIYAAGQVSGWSISVHNVAASGEIDHEVRYSGDGAMKLVNNSEYGSNKYLEVNTGFRAEKGKTYRYSFMAKAEDCRNVSTMIDWNYRTKESLILFGGTFDWTKYEFNYDHSDATSDVLVKFMLEDKGTFWVDNFECYEFENGVRVGENLIKNSTFDEYSKNGKYTPYDKTNEQELAKIKEQSGFGISEINKFMTGFKYVPVFGISDVIIDGEVDDWSGITKQKLPVSSEQYKAFDMQDGFDLKADLGYAFDEDNFYILINVSDDVHKSVSGSDYWAGDCVQLAIGTMEEAYGAEIGFSYNEQENEAQVHCSEDGMAEKISLAAKRDGTNTIYEAKIPWSVGFEQRPDKFLLSVLAADNDGEGREYVLELSDGISQDKSNKNFPVFETIDKETDFYMWIDGNRSANVGEESLYSVYLVNVGEKREFKLKYNGTEETLTVSAGEGIRRDFKIICSDMKDYKLEASAESGDKSYSTELDIAGSPSAEGVKAYIAQLHEYLKELKLLMKECEKQNIPTDYEKLAYTVIERWAKEYLYEDIENSWYKATEYTVNCLDTMYKEAKESLEGYLDGSKTAFSVPRYVSSKMDVDGFTVTADTVNSEGVKERRPVTFIGYGHFEDARADIPNFQNFGVNTIQNEIGANEIIMEAPGWSIAYTSGVDAKVGITEELAKNGKRSLKIVNNTPIRSNVYSDTSQHVELKPMTAYKLTLSVKADNANNAQISWNGGRSRFLLDDGTYDWKDYSFEFVTDEKTQSGQIWILSQDITDAMYIDDICLYEDGSDVNLIKNGDFESGKLSENGDYWIYPEGADWVVEMLDTAQKSNIAVSLLISPHYFPGFIYRLYPDTRFATETGAGNWSAFIPDHEKVKAVLKDYIYALIPRIKDFKSLNNICLTNEPGFRPEEYGDFYVPMWVDFLKNRYHNNLDELRTAHGENYSKWEDAKMDGVLHDGKVGESVCTYDTLLFAREVYAQWHKFLADTVHEIAPDIPVHAKAQGYLGLHGGFPYIMTNSSNFEYFNEFSDLAGCDYSIEWLGVTSGAHQVLGESLWYDYLAGIGEKPVINSEDHIYCDAEENFVPGQALWMQTNMWQGALHHRGFSQIWVWRKSYDTRSIYYGAMLFRPDCIEAIGRTNFDLNRLSYEVNAVVTEPEDVAILYSSASRQYNEDYMRSVYNAYEASLFNGKKVRIVTEGQIEKINQCKVLILPNCRNVPADVAEEIYKFAKNGGKIVMLGSDSLTKDEYNKAHDAKLAEEIKSMSMLIETQSEGADIKTPNQQELADIFEEYFKENGMQRVVVVDAETGERVKDTEWMSAEYNGNLIVNICNYDFDNPKRVKLVVDGEEVPSSTELRSGNLQGESFTVKSLESSLIRVGGDGTFKDIGGHWAEEDILSLYNRKMVAGTGNAMFSPDKNITRAEFTEMLTNALKIKDISGTVSEWYADCMEAAQKAGLNTGIFENNAEECEKPITREEMCVMLVRAYGLKNPEPAVGASPFSDREDAFEENREYIDKAYTLGLMHGREDGFMPKENSSRAEAAAVVNRLINIAG